MPTTAWRTNWRPGVRIFDILAWREYTNKHPSDPSVYPVLIHPDAERLGLQVIYDPSQLLSHIDAVQITCSNENKRPYPQSDNRFQSVDITQWTDVVINGDLAASLLSQYFVNDQPAFQLFDADLFLNDLAHGGHVYCSSQLVNALLAWTCVSS